MVALYEVAVMFQDKLHLAIAECTELKQIEPLVYGLLNFTHIAQYSFCHSRQIKK